MWLVHSHVPANWWKLIQLLGSPLSHTACENANLSPETSGRGETTTNWGSYIRCCVWARCQRFRKGREKKESARRHFCAREQHAARGHVRCGAVRSSAARCAMRHGLTVCATDHNRELTYGYFPRGSFDSSRSVAFAMSYTYAYYDSCYNQFGSWRGPPSVRRESSRSIVTERTWLRMNPTLKLFENCHVKQVKSNIILQGLDKRRIKKDLWKLN